MPPTPRLAALPLALLLATTACRGQATETWGFVATLGTDTTSVERITRQGDRIVAEAVGRSPVVVRRRWQATLAPDGALSRWSMDSYIPNAPAGERELHHELELHDGVARVVRQTGKDAVDRTVRLAHARTAPWNAFVYGTFELLFQVARGVPDSLPVGQYFFEGWAEGGFGYARLRRPAIGRIEIRSTGLAGTGTATLDERGRMVAYSGDGTTYHQEVHRVENVPDLAALLDRFAADERKTGVPRALSVRDTARAVVGRARFTIDYSRPAMRGRVLLGALIPYDQVWRTGANAATQLTTDAPIALAGVPLDRGAYTLWTLPTKDGVQLIINRETGQWGTGYRASADLARVAMHVDTLAAPVERFTIGVDTTSSRLFMKWGTFRWSVPVERVGLGESVAAPG